MRFIPALIAIACVTYGELVFAAGSACTPSDPNAAVDSAGNKLPGNRKDISLSLFGRTFRIQGRCVPSACKDGFYIETNGRYCLSNPEIRSAKPTLLTKKSTGVVNVQYRLDRALNNEAISAQISVSPDSTAIAGTDYDPSDFPMSVEIPAGSSSGSIQVRILSTPANSSAQRQLKLVITEVSSSRISISASKAQAIISIIDQGAATPTPEPTPTPIPTPVPTPTPKPTPIPGVYINSSEIPAQSVNGYHVKMRVGNSSSGAVINEQVNGYKVKSSINLFSGEEQ